MSDSVQAAIYTKSFKHQQCDKAYIINSLHGCGVEGTTRLLMELAGLRNERRKGIAPIIMEIKPIAKSHLERFKEIFVGTDNVRESLIYTPQIRASQRWTQNLSAECHKAEDRIRNCITKDKLTVTQLLNYVSQYYQQYYRGYVTAIKDITVWVLAGTASAVRTVVGWMKKAAHSTKVQFGVLTGRNTLLIAQKDKIVELPDPSQLLIENVAVEKVPKKKKKKSKTASKSK